MPVKARREGEAEIDVLGKRAKRRTKDDGKRKDAVGFAGECE